MSKKKRAGRPGGTGSKSKGEGGTRMSLLPWIALAVVVLAAGAFFLMQSRPAALPSEITAAQAYDRYQSGAYFLDVRSAAEYAEVHIPKSVLIPLDELAARLNEVPRDQDVIVICRSGVRSKEGAAILRQAGFSRVTCLTGGLRAWAEAGYPVQQGQ